MKTQSSASEIDKFTSISSSWWDVNGPFKMLHEINPTRLEYICNIVRDHIGKEDIAGLKILDIGCGGGIISVPLARLGARVTGLDAGLENIEIAKQYAASKDLDIEYICSFVEEITGQYEVILCLEIIEHVDDLNEFISHVGRLLKPGGIVICSTLNRTIKSFVLGIVAAEYLLRWVPRGTHDFKKFVMPSELSVFLEKNNIVISDIHGMSYNVIDRTWNISEDIGVNYFLSGVKK
jgi:2-polyprenyl-6-hydroxyphenyl methylase/3-demethylubiquinone-9 3-methyltransferase